jgi:hypothetical protein
MSVAALLALLLASPRFAAAYCRSVTASPPAGYDPAASGCFGFSDGGVTAGLYPLFWRNACVGYSFQPQASKYITLSQAEQVGQQAFNAWSSAQCPGGSPSISAVLFPPINCDQVPSAEHGNVIIFRDTMWPYDDSANAIGYTTLTVDLSSGEILAADTEINTAQWTIVAQPPVPSNGYDFATIMTHEAGHFLGLAHTGDTTAVMYARYHPGTTLQPDDINGICSIYLPEGTHSTLGGPIASTSCNPEPLAGFLSASCGSFDAGVVGLSSIGSGAGVSTNGLAVACPPDQSGCTVGAEPGSSPWGVGLLVGGVVGVAAIVRVSRRGSRRRAASALGVPFAMAVVGGLVEPTAHATISAAAGLDDLVRSATAVAVVTPVEQRAAWEGNRIVTMTRVRVDRLVAGHLPAEVRVRTHGGNVGRIGQIVEGQATFTVGEASLVFLRPHVDPATNAPSDLYVVVAGGQGQFPIATGDGKPSRLVRSSNVGALVEPPNKTSGVRSAGDVLDGRTVDDAAGEIVVAFQRLHPPT